MNMHRYILLVAGILLSLLLFSCSGAEDGDLTPPNFTFDGGIPNVTNEPGTLAFPYTISGTTDPDSELDVTINFPLIAPFPAVSTSTPVINPDGTWSVDVYDLVEGSNIFAFDVADPIGNSTVYYVTIILDLTGPVVSINQYPASAQQAAYSIAGTSELGSTVDIDVLDSSAVSVLPGGVPITGIPTTEGSGVWSVDIDFSALPTGTYTISAEGFDIFDNASAVKTTQEIVIDGSAPAFTLTAPVSLPEVIADPVNIDEVVFAGSKETDCALSVTTSTGTLINADFSDSFSFTADLLGSGLSIVTATVDGSTCPVPVPVNTVRHMLVLRDLTPPAVADIHPRSAEKVTAGAGIPISVVFGERMEVTTVLENQTVLLENVTVDDDIETFENLTPAVPFTVDQVTFNFISDPLTAGKYKVRIKNDEFIPISLKDERGNAFVGEASSTFIVE